MLRVYSKLEYFRVDLGKDRTTTGNNIYVALLGAIWTRLYERSPFQQETIQTDTATTGHTQEGNMVRDLQEKMRKLERGSYCLGDIA